MPTHHLRLFGIVQLLGPTGEEIRLKSQKQLAVLVFLALEAREGPISRERLADLFWCDAPYKRASHSLSQALSAIRTQLGQQAVPKAIAGVQLRSGLTTDIDSRAPRAFSPEDLRIPLPELETCGGSAFALWVETVRGRCLRNIKSCLLHDLKAARATGMVDQAYEVATRLHAVDPENDMAVLVIAEHLCAIGDSAAAIRLLRSHVALYNNELKRDPPRQVLGLLHRLERGLVPILVDPLPNAQVSSRRCRGEVFLGREQELMRLESLWSSARQDDLVTGLVTGPGGIGKTTLIRRFTTSLAARGLPVVLVRCQEMGRNIPFAAISDLTWQLAQHPDASGTDSHWLAQASRVTPGLRAVYKSLPEPQPISAEAVRLLVVEALIQMLDVVRDGGPLLLAIDDLQHIDVASCEVMHRVIRRLEESPTFLLATAGDRAFRRLPPEISGLVEWQNQIRLEALDNECTRKMIGALAIGEIELREDVCSKIAELSRGNPYLTEMLVSDWRNNAHDSLVAAVIDETDATASWRLPETMRRAFLRQYQGLTPDAERMSHILAVAGRSIPTRELDNLLNPEDSSIDQAVLELIDRAIIRTSNGALGFTNELHRAFVYFEIMSQEARSYHHARLGQYLTSGRDEHDFQWALEASHHFLRAGMINDAVKTVCAGADLAITKGAPKEAEKALQGVRRECSTERAQDIDLLLARALVAEGRFNEALTAIGAWKASKPTPYEEALEATTRVEALHRGRLADDSTIRQSLRKALDLTEKCNDAILSMRAMQISAEVASDTGDQRALASMRARAAHIQQTSTNPQVQALATLTQGYCLLVAGDLGAAVLQLGECVNEFERLSLELEFRQALNGLGIAYYFVGEFHEAIAAFDHAIKSAARIGDSVASATSWSNLGAVYEDLGQLPKAEACYCNALDHESVASNPRRAVEVHLNLASLKMLMGDLGEAERCIDVARQHVDKTGLWWLMTDVRLSEADWHLFSSNPEYAWPLVEEGQANAKGRRYLLSDMTRFERLRRHYLWVTQGVSSIKHLTRTDDLSQRCFKVSGRLEVAAFEQWIMECENEDSGFGSDAFEELKTRKLFGVVTRIEMIRKATLGQLGCG